MDNLQAILKNRRNMIIIGAVISVIVILFIVAVLASSGKPSQSQVGINPSPTSFITQDNQNIQNLPFYTRAAIPSLNVPSGASIQTVPQGWVIGDNPQYTIDFPQNWKATVNSIQGGGTVAVLQPQNLTGGNYFPRLDIEVSPTNPARSIANRIKTLSPLHLQQSSVLFNGIPVTELNGVLPLKFQTGNPQQTPVYKTFLLFEHNGYTYITGYSYYQDETAIATQQLLQQMLSTLTLK